MSTKEPFRSESASVEVFFERLEQSGLVTTELIKEYKEKINPTLGLEKALHEIYQSQLLTAWQLREIAAGRTDFLVDERYLLLTQLGRGAMGTVYKVLKLKKFMPIAMQLANIESSELRALKMLNETVKDNKKLEGRFNREARLSGQTKKHDNLVLTEDAGLHEGSLYIVMEFLEGEDLKGKKNLDPLVVCNYILQALRGLSCLHSWGIIHRDIKPGNLRIVPGPQGDTVKILDLGLGRLIDDPVNDGLTHEQNTKLGTIEYMAPEQAKNVHTAAEPADIYGLGCTMFFLLTGRVPVPRERSKQEPDKKESDVQYLFRVMSLKEAPRLIDFRPDLAPELSAIVSRMTELNWKKRYQTADQVIDSLESFLNPVTCQVIHGETKKEPATLVENFDISIKIDTSCNDENQPQEEKKSLKDVSLWALALATLLIAFTSFLVILSLL